MKTKSLATLFAAALLAATLPAAAQESGGVTATVKTAIAEENVSKVDSILSITNDLSVIELSLTEIEGAKNARLVRAVLQRTLDHQLLWIEDMDFTEQELAAKTRIAALAAAQLKKLGLATDDKALRDDKSRAALLKNLKALKLPETLA